MISILGYAVLVAGIGVFLWFKRRDWAKSALQPLHLPPGERNFATKGKDGYFDQTRSYIVSGAVIAIGVLAAIFTPWPYSPFLVGGMFAAWGMYVMDGIRKDIERMNANLDKQKATLIALRADPEGNHLGDARLRGFGKKTVWVFGTFYDFHTDVVDASVISGVQGQNYFIERSRAEGIMKPRLVALSKLPESEWFSLSRSKKV